MPAPAKISKLWLKGYRSIDTPIELTFPAEHPVVLIGENNAGKSNIVRALELLLGQYWPGNHEPDDNEFFGRNRSTQILIAATFPAANGFGRGYTSLEWRYTSETRPAIQFRAAPGFSGREADWPTNEDRSTLTCVLIEAERNLRYQLSYVSKYTLLSRIMQRFHRALSEDAETTEELRRLFGEVRGRFNSIQPFVDFTEMLQTRLGEFSSNMAHRLEVDFEAYNPVNFFHSLRLQAVEGDERRTLDEMGTGEQQILALSLAYAYASAFHEGMILVVEEPEAHLHPLAQQWLARRVRQLCRDGLQVLITTHSSYFIDLMGLEGLAIVRKDGNRTVVYQQTVDQLVSVCVSRGAPENRTRRDGILSYYAANATPEILDGLLARAVVLVEGRTESLALPEYFRRLDFDHTQAGVAILPVGGKGNLAKWVRLFESYAIPCYVVFDNDNEDDSDGSKRIDLLVTLGLDASDQRPLIEDSNITIRERYCVFGRDFESSLRELLPEYAALESEARALGTETKPFVARWVAERIALDNGSTGHRVLSELVSAIQLRPLLS